MLRQQPMQAPITALYCRLSHDDERAGDSLSIENQKRILEAYAKDHGLIPYTFYIDDGWSGANFERPGFTEMMDAVENGAVKTVVTKDLSRLGRNYLQVGLFTEITFPKKGVRFIAINDGVDSAQGDNDMSALKNLFNEWLLRDTSRKIRAILNAKANAGEHMGKQPYGYLRDKDNPKQWVVDGEAAEVVKKIFALCVDGKGPMQIARILQKEKVLTVKSYYAKCAGKPLPDNPYLWDANSVSKILARFEYCGHTVNFKTYSKSNKLKKRYENTPENRRIFRNTHEAIIDEKLFERVQELRASKRRPAKQAERQGLFSNLIFCADCGSKLHFCTASSLTPSQDSYRCSRYKSNTGSCTAHYIREETLKRIVLKRIFDVTAMFIDDITSFRDMVYEQRFEKMEKDMKRRKKALEQARKRITELDRIFKRIYEDDVNGTISHERFLKLSAEYEAEQKELTEFVYAEQNAVHIFEQDKADFDNFAAVIRKYVGVKELTPTIVNEFVKKIIVHAPDKSSGHRRQKVQIVWNFIGEVNLPGDSQVAEWQRKSRTA